MKHVLPDFYPKRDKSRKTERFPRMQVSSWELPLLLPQDDVHGGCCAARITENKSRSHQSVMQPAS